MRAREKEGGEGGSVNIKSRRNCLFKSFYHFFSAAGREGAYIMSYKEDFTIYIYTSVFLFFSLAYLLRIKNAQNALFSALSRLWRLTVFFFFNGTSGTLWSLACSLNYKNVLVHKGRRVTNAIIHKPRTYFICGLFNLDIGFDYSREI